MTKTKTWTGAALVAGLLLLTGLPAWAATYTVPMNSNAVVMVPGFWASNSVATLTNLTDTSNVLSGAALRVPYATNAAYSTNAGIAATATNALWAGTATNLSGVSGTPGQIVTLTASGLAASNAPATGIQSVGAITFNVPFYDVDSGSFSDPVVWGVLTNINVGLATAGPSQSGALTYQNWNTFDQKAPTNRTLTIAGTADQIVSSAGAQSLAANRTWTLSLPQSIGTNSEVTFGKVTATNASLTGTFSGSGTGLTNVVQSLAAGTNIVIVTNSATSYTIHGTASGTGTSTTNFNGIVVTNTVSAGSFSGNGFGLTNLQSTNIVGLVAGSGLTNGQSGAWLIGQTNFGSSGLTNWSVTTSNGWFTTNVAGGRVSIAGGNVMASGTVSAGSNYVSGGSVVMGNVGIGTTSPGAKLDVYDVAISNSILLDPASTSYGIRIKRNTAGGWQNTGYGFRGGVTGTDFGGLGALGAGDSLTHFYIGTSANKLVTIESGGNVGIGIIAPAALLHVNGNAIVSSLTVTNVLTNSLYEGVIRATSTSPGSVPAIDIPAWPSTNTPALTISTTGIVVSNAVAGGLGTVSAGSNYVSGGATVMGKLLIANGSMVAADATNRVGVNTMYPKVALDVRIPSASDKMTPASANGAGFSLNYGQESFGLFAGVSGNGWTWLQGGSSANTNLYDIQLQGAGGKVAIGKSTAAAATLDVGGNAIVSGSLTATNFIGMGAGLTNSAGSGYVGQNELNTSSNYLYNSAWLGGTFTNSVFTVATNLGPANNELVTAGFVRNLFAGSGVTYYASTNVTTYTNTDAATPVYAFSSTIPIYASRSYTNPSAGTYIGSVATTNRLFQLNAGATVNAYLGMTGGGAAVITVKPEIYLSYDGTNWFGDWDATSQAITKAQTNLYSWVVPNPSYTSTNPTGFIVERRFKVVTQAGTPTIVFHIGTNFASHVTLSGSSAYSGNVYAASDNVFTGSNTFRTITATNFVGNGAGLTNLTSSGGGTNSGPLTLSYAGTNVAVNAATPAGCVTNAPLTFRLTMTNSCLLVNPVGAQDGQRITIEFIQDAVGGRVAYLENGYLFGSDITEITLSTTASKRDFATFLCSGTNWYCVGFTRGY